MSSKTIDTQEVIDAAVKLVKTTILDAIREGAGKSPISNGAEVYWINHYARTFAFATVLLERNWSLDEAKVLEQARNLGSVAAGLTFFGGTIERYHARAASGLLDCDDWYRPGKTPAYKWC